jgi:hypothetical protein
MPTKRRHVVRLHRTRGLTEGQRTHLECGHDFFGDGRPFTGEAARRAAWRAHRRAILAGWDTPGARPLALWQYDLPDALDEHGSEAAAVHALLADSRERRQIELHWLAVLDLLLGPGFAREHVPELAAGRGVPAWFTDRELPALAVPRQLIATKTWEP